MAEFAWIGKYLKPIAHSSGAMSLANDVAVVRQTANTALIATMDTLAEGVHFLKADPLQTVGRKLVLVNASDIICKGGVPAEALLSISMPDDFTEAMFAEFCSGLGSELAARNIALLGGDTVRTSGPLSLSLTLVGHCNEKGPVPRSGASVGDVVCVSGPIGRGRLGLMAALGTGNDSHIDFYRLPTIPDHAWSSLIAEYATASIDISDGLLSDADHIARESSVQLTLDLDTVPWASPCDGPDEMIRLATGGDDYQILFTLAERSIDSFRQSVADLDLQTWIVGQVCDGQGIQIRLDGNVLPLPAVKGYEH